MKKLTILSTFLMLNVLLFAQNTWYVRPAFTGQTYGTEDGTSYDNAWNGLEILNGKFQDGTIGPTDEIYICGRHVFHDTLPHILIAIQGKIGIKSGLDSLHHLIIRGDYPGDPGVIWGHSRMDYEDWNYRGNNVWSIPLYASYNYNWYFQDIETTNPNNPIILGVATDFPDLENSPGKMYLPPPYDSLFVHLTDNGNPTHRVYSYFFGYSFDWDNYINTYAPLHYITFKNLTLYAVSGLPSTHHHHHLRWDGCKIAWEKSYGITFWKGQDYNEVVNCDIGWCGNGVYGIDNTDEGGANFILVQNNHFHDIGVLPEHQNSDEHAVGLQGGTGWIIEDNYIERCGSGPLLYAYTNQRLTNMTIRRNFIKDLDSDGSATGFGVSMQCNAYSLSDKSGNKVYQNIVVNAVRGYYINYEDGVEVYNNVAYSCGIGYRTSRNLPPGTYFAVDMKNNISYNPGNAHIEYISGTTPMNSDYNLFYPDSQLLYFIPVAGTNGANLKTWQTYSYPKCVFDPNSNAGDPLFVNASGSFSEPEDFKLLEGSPAIDAGTDVGLTKDFGGNPVVGKPDIGAWEYQSPLGVEYLSPLQAYQKDDGVMLKWVCVEDQNTDYFEIEQSDNAQEWHTIGKRKGRGISYAQEYYYFFDSTPHLGLGYYRLKHVDYNGAFSYSKIASVYFEKMDIGFYPKLSNGSIEIELPNTANAYLQVFDMQGKVVLQKPVKGTHFSLNLNHLPDGMYLINLQFGGKTVSKKFVLQR